MRRARLSATLAALTLTAALAGTATAAAAPAAESPTAVPPCATGYVCVEQGGGIVTLVPEGSPYAFDPPVRTLAVVNSTRIAYCLVGSYNSAVGPGEVFEPLSAYTLQRLTPAPSGYCLTDR